MTNNSGALQIAADSTICALRNRIERYFNCLRSARRITTRYDKLVAKFFGFFHLAAERPWLRHFVKCSPVEQP